MFIEINEKSSSSSEFIDSSCLIRMEIVDINKRNEFAAVKKGYGDGRSHILEAETVNNVIVNDRLISNGFPTDSLDSEAVILHAGTEDECLERLENLQSSLNWLKAENAHSVIPHGSYINPSSVMRLNMYERLNSHLHKPNTHHIDCILKHRYIPAIKDFIPIEYATRLGRDLEKFMDDLIRDPNQSGQKITGYIRVIRKKLESIIKHKEVRLFVGDKSQCERKLRETIDFLDRIGSPTRDNPPR